mmetsp:Transcript_21297/g.50253  ORF Transcript_21297/g.50253 Transcript_21297/m.50253 type:complete len:226 (+) Transcript_21297:1155-1832(+)
MRIGPAKAQNRVDDKGDSTRVRPSASINMTRTALAHLLVLVAYPVRHESRDNFLLHARRLTCTPKIISAGLELGKEIVIGVIIIFISSHRVGRHNIGLFLDIFNGLGTSQIADPFLEAKAISVTKRNRRRWMLVLLMFVLGIVSQYDLFAGQTVWSSRRLNHHSPLFLPGDLGHSIALTETHVDRISAFHGHTGNAEDTVILHAAFIHHFAVGSKISCNVGYILA